MSTESTVGTIKSPIETPLGEQELVKDFIVDMIRERYALFSRGTDHVPLCSLNFSLDRNIKSILHEKAGRFYITDYGKLSEDIEDVFSTELNQDRAPIIEDAIIRITDESSILSNNHGPKSGQIIAAESTTYLLNSKPGEQKSIYVIRYFGVLTTGHIFKKDLSQPIGETWYAERTRNIATQQAAA